MDKLFYNCKYNGDLSKWDVSNVEWFDEMFRKSAFTGDISMWQISTKAKGHMNKMFVDSPMSPLPTWYYKYRH